MIGLNPIGVLAKAAGVKVTTIRYYEGIGLLPSPPRTASDRRLYDDADARRLSFIRHARELGFPIEAIRSLLDLSSHPELPCDAADRIAAEQLSSVENKIAQLESLRMELARISKACKGGTVGKCSVIEALADHELCQTQHPAPGGRAS